MLWRAILLEKDKVFGRRIFWAELALLALVILVIDVAQYVLSRALPPASARVVIDLFAWPAGLINAVQFAGSHALGGILLIILVSVITAREYSWRTFHLWLSRGVSRMVLLEAKCIIAVLLTVTMVGTSLLISGILTAILTVFAGGTLNITSNNLEKVVLNVLITNYSLLPYVALAFMLTILSRSSVLSISVGFAFLFLVEVTLYTALTLVGGTAAQIVHYLPIGLEDALQRAISPSQSSVGSTAYPAPLVACACIALYTVVFASIAMWRFLHQNFTD